MGTEEKKKRVVSGMRPTGELHLGHYFGALKNWLDLQSKHDCIFISVDWHALTSDYKQTDHIKKMTISNIIDWLASGIDPEKSTICVQSRILEHAELALLLSMITPLSWLERNPTYKEQIKQIKNKDLSTLGFLSYPVLQTADILIYNGALVPVGEDQVAHVELSREIARRFNHFYGDVFKEPDVVLTKTPRLRGSDGRKMSNSYNNAIFLSDSAKEIEKKVMPFMTDPARVRRQDPGEPAKCPLFDLHKVLTEREAQIGLEDGCRNATIGCVDCKKELLKRFLPWHEAYAEKRAYYEKTPKLVEEIIEQGCKRARSLAQETMSRVRGALKL